MGISEREERKGGGEELFERIMAENFPELMIDSNPQIQEEQRTSKINTK